MTVRCVQLAATAATKGSKDKPGGQLKSDNKKPIVALAAHHADRQSLLVLYADGTLSSFLCSLFNRTMTTQWTLPVEGPRSQITKVASLTCRDYSIAIYASNTAEQLCRSCFLSLNLYDRMRWCCCACRGRCMQGRIQSSQEERS